MTLEQTLDVLLDDDLEPIVEMVLCRGNGGRGNGGYDVRAADGRVRFRRHDDGHGWRFEVEAVEGRNPLGDPSDRSQMRRSRPAQYRSRSSRFRILPLSSLGRAATNATPRGHL